MEYYENALTISIEIGAKRLEGNILGNIGLCHNFQNHFKIARQYYEAALEISREMEDKRNEGATLAKLGLNYFSNREMESAMNYYEMCLDIGNELNDSDMIDNCNYMLELISLSVN
jgi:tetratricopeptide (TPR) repeat protein